MEHCSGENADITEWEIDDYKEKSYVELKCGNQSFKISDVAYTCPYCPEKRGRHLFYEDLFQHASGIGKSKVRTARDRAKHLALAKYLEADVAGAVGPSKSSKELKSGTHSFRISDIAFACPYCPETTKRDFSYKDLLQHANGIGSCNSMKRTAKDKANHLALFKRLENDVAGSTSSAKSYEESTIKKKSYEESMNRNRPLKISNMTFSCPYCPETRERKFSYKDLLQHAYGIGSSNSLKRTASHKADHLALAKNLENDIAGFTSSSKSYEEWRSGSIKISNMAFACPYCPETRNRDFSYVDLFQHVNSVGTCNSITRTAIDMANHLALAKSLENDVAAGKLKSYEALKSRNYSLKISDTTSVCAYPETRNRDSSYKDLLQHASGVGSSNSNRQTSRDKANHLAYAKYLENDVAGAAGASKSYEESTSGKHSFNLPDRTFACAYCPETRNRNFSYKDLWQHALGVGTCDSKKRTATDKANHLALSKHLQNFAKYLEDDLLSAASTSMPYERLKSGYHSFNNSDVAFACPYCPDTRNKYFSYKDLLQHAGSVGSCNSKKRTARDKANHLALAKYLSSDVTGGPGKSISYEELSGNNSFSIPNGAYTFMYCPNKRKRDFLYKDLILPASEVGSCSSNKRSAKDQANHITFAKYFGNDVAGAASPLKPDTLGDLHVGSLADHDRSEMFVWPWIGVVVNLPTEFKDGRYVGESGSNLKDQLLRKGFNPTRVRTLWNDLGHSGIALVEFKKDWFGFSNAISFEKAYEADDHGKKNWEDNNDKKSDCYAWIARADDYESTNVVGERLRKVGDLRTVSNIIEEESRKNRILVSSLTNSIEVKKLHIKVLEDKLQETIQSVEQLIVVNAKLRQANNEG